MNDKITAEIEIPKNVGTNDPIFRLLLEDVAKSLRTARAISKKRLTVVITQSEK